MPKLTLAVPPCNPNFKGEFYQLVEKAKFRMAPRLSKKKIFAAEVAREALEFYLDHTTEPQLVFTRKDLKKCLAEKQTKKRIYKEDSHQPPEAKKQRLLNDPIIKVEPEANGDFAEELSRIVDRASEELADVQASCSYDAARSNLEISKSENETADVKRSESENETADVEGSESENETADIEVFESENETDFAEATTVGREAAGDLDEEDGEALGQEEEPFVVTHELEMAYQADPNTFYREKLLNTAASGVSDYVCEYCGYAKRQCWSIFKNHIATHMPESEFEYQCEICAKKFPSLKYLGSHRRIIHEKRIYKKPATCDRCGKVCRSKGMLKRHMVVHSGARPFVCNTCGASFNQNSNLTVHMKSHAKNNEALKEWFPCPHCDVRCGNKRGLESHLKSHE